MKTTPSFDKFIIFEGLDKTGKTTLSRRCRFEAIPAHPAMILDRGFLTRRVFHRWNFEPNFPIEQWNNLEEILISTGHYGIVWLRAGIPTILERHRIAGEACFKEEELFLQDQMFELEIRVLQRREIPVLEIWTDRHTEDFCVEKILKFLGFEWRGNAAHK